MLSKYDATAMLATNHAANIVRVEPLEQTALLSPLSRLSVNGRYRGGA